MDAGPVDVQPTTAELELLLEAGQSDARTVGPISPELVLVDPVLAEYARKLLPEPGWATRQHVPIAVDEPARSVAPAEPPELSVASAVRPVRRRLLRTVVLAGLTFAAGATCGGLLGVRHAAPSGIVLEVKSAGLMSPSPTSGGKSPLTASPPMGRRSSAPAAPKRLRDPTISAREQPGRLPRRAWAANVLGVAAQIAGPAVKLVWQRPPDSGHVVVLRTLGDRGWSRVVYRGRATSFRDVSPRPCRAYRYTIVNYDRQGQHSTGVPTSVLTSGCT